MTKAPLDAAARRSARRVARNGAESKARLDAELVQVARKIGRHGIANFIECVRQRCSVRITDAYARDLLLRGGYPSPKA